MRIIFAIMIALVAAACSRVEPNHVGVLMENYGKSGKADFSLQRGRVSTMMPGTELYQVPLWEQRADFAGRVLHLKASDNTEFTSTPMYSYKVIEARAIDLVFENKHLDGDSFLRSLEDNVLETQIYDLMKSRARSYTTDELMANGGSLKLEENVEALVRKVFLDRGLQLVMFSAQLEFTASVKAKIDNRNEVNTNITVLDQKIAEQRKQNELAELIRDENLLKSQGITPELLQQAAIEKWNGVLPLYMTDTPVQLFQSTTPVK